MNQKRMINTAGTTRYLKENHKRLITASTKMWKNASRIAQLVCLLGSYSLAATSQADVLWDNGDHDNGGAGVNNNYQSVLDDFYVPGAGWYLNSAETYGIFLTQGLVVSDVDVAIWPAEPLTGLPNGDTAFSVNTNSFEAVDTGESWGGYEKIKVTVDFENTFLQGQEYYWIELDIKDQYGQRLKLLQRQSINYQNAHIGPGPGPFSSGVDLGFRLFGTPIVGFSNTGPDKLLADDLDKSPETVTLQIASAGKALPPGYYQIMMQHRSPIVYHFGQKGKQRFEFRATPVKSSKFHTPIGDDMCEKAPSEIYDYCQSFVACAAYDLFCPGL
jgi:hypothetical protein